MNRDPRMQLAETMAYICWVIFIIGLVIGFFAGAAFAGEATGADLAAPIPICSEIKLALADFEGLHSDAYAQYEKLIDSLCALPDDTNSWVILGGFMAGKDIPPAPVPLPAPLWLLLAALSLFPLPKGKLQWLKLPPWHRSTAPMN